MVGSRLSMGQWLSILETIKERSLSNTTYCRVVSDETLKLSESTVRGWKKKLHNKVIEMNEIMEQGATIETAAELSDFSVDYYHRMLNLLNAPAPIETRGKRLCLKITSDAGRDVIIEGHCTIQVGSDIRITSTEISESHMATIENGTEGNMDDNVEVEREMMKQIKELKENGEEEEEEEDEDEEEDDKNKQLKKEENKLMIMMRLLEHKMEEVKKKQKQHSKMIEEKKKEEDDNEDEKEDEEVEVEGEIEVEEEDIPVDNFDVYRHYQKIRNEVFTKLPQDKEDLLNDVVWRNIGNKRVFSWTHIKEDLMKGLLAQQFPVYGLYKYIDHVNEYQKQMVNKFPDHYRMVVMSPTVLDELQKGEYNYHKGFQKIKSHINIFIGTKYVVLPVAIPNRADPYAVIVVDLVSKTITFFDPQRREDGQLSEDEDGKNRLSLYTKLIWKFLHDYAVSWGFSNDKGSGYFQDNDFQNWKNVYGHGPPTRTNSVAAAAMVMDMLIHGIRPRKEDFYIDRTFTYFERRMAYACYEGKHPDMEHLAQTPHFGGLLLKAQLKSSHQGSGALDLVKGTALNLAFYFYHLIRTGVSKIWWLGPGGLAEFLIIWCSIYPYLQTEIRSSLRVAAVEIIPCSTFHKNIEKVLKKYPFVSLKDILLYIVGGNFLDTDLPADIAQSNTSLMWSIATSGDKFYRQAMINALENKKIRFFLISQRWINSFDMPLDGNITDERVIREFNKFSHEVLIEPIKSTLSVSTGSLPVCFFQINSEKHKRILIRRFRAQLEYCVDEPKSNQKRQSVTSTRAGEGSTFIGQSDNSIKSRMPLILNMTLASSTVDEMNETIDRFMRGATETILLPPKNTDETPNHTAATLTESTNAAVDSYPKASPKDIVEESTTPMAISRGPQHKFGIPNLGTTCWLSSGVVFLYHVMSNGTIESNMDSFEPKYRQSFKDLFNYLYSSLHGKSVAAVKPIVTKLVKAISLPSRTEQDPSEFIAEALVNASQNGTSRFTLECIVETMCTNKCGNFKMGSEFENLYMLELPPETVIPSTPPVHSKKGRQIKQIKQPATKPKVWLLSDWLFNVQDTREEIEATCACGCQISTRQCVIHPTDILVIQLKITDKNGNKIDPKKRGLIINRRIQIYHTEYELIAAILHKGSRSSSGHYMCTYKDHDGSWKLADDSKIVDAPKMMLDDVLSPIHAKEGDPCILGYRKIASQSSSLDTIARQSSSLDTAVNAAEVSSRRNSKHPLPNTAFTNRTLAFSHKSLKNNNEKKQGADDSSCEYEVADLHEVMRAAAIQRSNDGNKAAQAELLEQTSDSEESEVWNG